MVRLFAPQTDLGLNYLCMLALVLKNLSDGNTGVEKMLHLFLLSIYVENHYLMNILAGCVD